MTRRMLFSLALMIGAVLGLQGSASADIYLELTDSGGNTTGILTNATDTISFTGTPGGAGGYFLVTLTTATSTAPGTPGAGTLTISNFTVSLTAAGVLAGGSPTLTVDAKGTNFLFPSGMFLNMDSSESATATLSTAGDHSMFTSYFDASNTAPPPVGNFTIGTASPSLNLVSPGGTTGSVSANAATTGVTRTGAMYAIASETQISINVAGGTTAIVSMNGNTVITAAVPEPSSMTLAGLGTLGLIGYGLRRRRGQGA
jgi:hypothetical protein